MGAECRRLVCIGARYKNDMKNFVTKVSVLFTRVVAGCLPARPVKNIGSPDSFLA